ncbi:hypothetical protein HYC85_022329 [Camellia sinensis]|uniref:Uncharacterized protein n=1 Tax=Camellia sinensis TaxID=4442 RepID=A0A7J7GK29_CAMSI|nr:hypothetical protein HYC85_022329 [Camellia sinensis]
MHLLVRLWWPTHLSSTHPASSIFLFGWFVSSPSASLDIVVAFACDEASLSSIQSRVEGIIRETSGSMPVSLQDKCMFSLLGHCAVDLSCNGQSLTVGVEENSQINSTNGNICTQSSQYMLDTKYGRWSCGCYKYDGLLDHCELISAEKNIWIQLVYDSHGYIGRKIKWIPKLHHIHWNGQRMSHFDVHVIGYETPMFGSHHFSLGFWSSDQVKNPLKKPKWFEELHQKQPLLDLDTVVLAINCANAAKLFFERHVGPERSTVRFPIVYMCVNLTWQLLAMSIASLSTLFYIIFQFLHVLLSSKSQSWMYLTLEKVFSKTWKNIQIRCSQILYWPIFLKDDCLRSHSCVEYAEKATFHKHSKSACVWVSNFADDITNYLLRTGCVWLMGVPAGFKLNTELARVLGMISLNAIQIWSTLWFFVGSLFIHFVEVLAISAVVFGLTTPAALIIDMILLATLHVSTLHWLISHLYSHQIQAITALWRLFSGILFVRDMIAMTTPVEQHIVGSLLFTPLLLLLPTTSVFYIFFTIMKTTISFICIAVEFIISVIHATPYIKIFLWFVRPRRFPSGIWFEIISCQSNAVDPMDIGCLHDTSTPSERTLQRPDQSSVLVSYLHSNFSNIRQVVWPHYRYVFSVVSRSFVASSAYGVLTGKRIPSTLGTGLPSTMPWMLIPYKEYWLTCRDAVLACKADRHRDSFQ